VSCNSFEWGMLQYDNPKLQRIVADGWQRWCACCRKQTSSQWRLLSTTKLNLARCWPGPKIAGFLLMCLKFFFSCVCKEYITHMHIHTHTITHTGSSRRLHRFKLNDAGNQIKKKRHDTEGGGPLETGEQIGGKFLSGNNANNATHWS